MRSLGSRPGLGAAIWAAAMALVVTIGVVVSSASADPREDDEGRPNILFVLIDDADTKLIERMPAAQALLADGGATLENFIFNQPLCCPSRATMMRGQYNHNTGVQHNGPPDGGYAS